MPTNTNIVAICGQKGSGKDTVADILRKRYDFVSVAFADPFKRLLMELFQLKEEVLWGSTAIKEKPLRELVDPEMDETFWIGVHSRMDVNADRINDLFSDGKTAWCPDAIPSLVLFLRDFKRKNPDELTLRHVMQQIGSQWGRRLWKDVWCYHACRTVEHMAKGHSYTRAGGVDTSKVLPNKPTNFMFTDCRFPDNEAAYARNMGAKFWWIDASKRNHVPFTGKREHDSEPFKEDFLDAGYSLTVVDNNGPLKDLKSVVKKAIKQSSQ